METLSPILIFLGGLGLFLYGVQTISDGLQRFAANRLRQILQSLTKHTYLAILFGMFMTVAFQSSTATTVLVVEFVNAGLMNLAQALGMVLGSAVGTSISIQLLAFQILDWAFGLIFIGFIMLIGSKRWKYLGQALTGFGIIYVGMSNMSTASAPLLNIPEVSSLLLQLGSHPFLAILIALILNVLLQGSTAVLAIMMSLAAQHLLPFEAVVPLILGSHLGGTFMTLLSSLTVQKMDAKRVALANTAYKVVAIILIFPLLSPFEHLVQLTTNDLQRQVANAYLLFALLMVIIFLPFNNMIAKLLVRLLPERAKATPRQQFRFIDESSLEVPSVALNQALQEISGMGERIWMEMLLPLPDAMMDAGDEPVNRIGHSEMDVDWYYRHISRFLMALSQKGLTDEQSEQGINAQFIVKELEYVGDAVMSIVQQIHKIHREDLRLKEKDWEALSPLHAKISENFARMLEALKRWDTDIAAGVITEHPDILRLQRAIQFSSLARPLSATADIKNNEKLRYAIVDMVNLFYSIDEHVVNIAQVIMGIA